jgi:hypothetical protein
VPFKDTRFDCRRQVTLKMLGKGRDWFIAGLLAGAWILYDYQKKKETPVKVDLEKEQMSSKEVEQWNASVKSKNAVKEEKKDV